MTTPDATPQTGDAVDPIQHTNGTADPDTVEPTARVVVTAAGLQRLLPGYAVPSDAVSEEVDQMRML